MCHSLVSWRAQEPVLGSGNKTAGTEREDSENRWVKVLRRGAGGECAGPAGVRPERKWRVAQHQEPEAYGQRR